MAPLRQFLTTPFRAGRTQGVALLVVILPSILLGAWIAGPMQEHLGISESTEQADLIVVARVLGLADSKPEAQTRRHLEVHLIEVERTLKGHDVSGRQIAVRPNPLRWQDGQSYVIFLNPELPGGAMANAVVSQPMLTATQANVTAVADEVASQGATVTPALILWMTETAGSQRGTVTELLVSATGNFEWRKRQPAEGYSEPGYDLRTGRLSIAAIDDLIREVTISETGDMVDDAPTVTFGWLGSAGETHFRTFYLLGDECRGLGRSV